VEEEERTMQAGELSAMSRQIRKKAERGRRRFIFFCILPAFLFLAVFMYYPIAETFRLSFMKSSGLGADRFIGWENYKKLFASEEFQQGLLHVFLWAFWSIIIQLPLAFFIAFSLTFYINRFTRPMRAIFYLANVLPSAITAMLGKFVFSPTNGILNSIGANAGWKWLEDIDFLGDVHIAFWSVFAVATWAYTGFPIIFLMSKIEQMPKDMKEAAEIDGVTGWKYAWYIVLPNLKGAFRILAVLCTIGSLKLFDLPYMMTTGGPGYATITLGISLYRQGFINWQYGRASAIGVVILILSLVFTVLEFAGHGGDEGGK
jgi:ABC-type sugar transport system permease subunit